MSDTDNKAEIISSLTELFTEYVSLHRKYNEGMFEFKVPWHHITQIEGRDTDPSEYPKNKENGTPCSDLWWTDKRGNHQAKFLETPDEIEAKITEARNKTLAAIKKNRMLVI